MTSTTEYMIFSDTRALLREARQSHKGFEATKLGINPILQATSSLIERKSQLKRTLQKNIELSDLTSTNLIAAEKIGLQKDFKLLNKKKQQAIQDSIELRSAVKNQIERLTFLQEKIIEAAEHAAQNITKNLSDCVKEKLKLSQAQLDPIFMCQDIEDLECYLQQQGLTIQSFCEVTKIPKSALLTIEESGESFCKALIMAAVIAKTGPLEHYDLDKTRATKNKIKKDSDPILPCMKHYDTAMATFNAQLSEITQELQHQSIKKAQQTLQALNQNLVSINEQVAQQVQNHDLETSFEARAKGLDKSFNATAATSSQPSNANTQHAYASSKSLKPN